MLWILQTPAGLREASLVEHGTAGEQATPANRGVPTDPRQQGLGQAGTPVPRAGPQRLPVPVEPAGDAQAWGECGCGVSSLANLPA